MDVEKAFHMAAGVGKTSYAKNSTLQKKASDMVKDITIQTIQEVYIATGSKSLGIADLGCSSGPNTLSIIKDLVAAIEGMSGGGVSELRFYLNDLPTNDFNSIFKALPEFYRDLKHHKNGGCSSSSSPSPPPSIFIAAYPGSFYGRLFPNNTLHFVYSSYSLHWLSKVPDAIYDEYGRSINKENIYISETSPDTVSHAYYNQFHQDFSLFLQLRAQEVVNGGKMVIILLGRIGPSHVDRGNSFFWRLLSQSLANLASQGKIEQEKLNSYEVHFYAPTKEELEEEVKREGSFELDHMKVFEIERDHSKSSTTGNMSYGTVVATTVRAVQESMIREHFGGAILDVLFESYGKLIDEEMAKEEIKPITFLLVLQKKQML